MSPPLSDLTAEIDALYRLALPEFTPGRNALATRVKAEQGKDAAAAIKALEKPSLSAWVVNQLFWRHRRLFDRLLQAGDELRASQQQRLAGRDADVNAAIDVRREAMATLMATVTDLLEENGSTSPDIRQRVETTIEALSVYGTSESAPRVGRLTGDVQPPGFAALAALVPAGPGGFAARPAAKPGLPGFRGTQGESGLRMVERRPDASAGASAGAAAGKGEKALTKAEAKAAEQAHQKASEALEQAEADLAQARRAAQQAAAAQTKAQTEWDAAREALEEVQRTLDEAMERERAAQVGRHERRRAAAQATQALGRAERLRDEAERYLQSLGSP